MEMKAYMLSDYERRHLVVLDRIATALESIEKCMVGEEYVEPPEEEVSDDDSVQLQSESEYEVL
jgi:hypothetical protein